MADLDQFRRLKITRKLDHEVLVTEFENDAEQRRLKHENELRTYKLELSAAIKSEALAFEQFFLSKKGALLTFTMTDPINDEEYICRFVPGTYETEFEAAVYKSTVEVQTVNHEAQ